MAEDGSFHGAATLANSSDAMTITGLTTWVHSMVRAEHTKARDLCSFKCLVRKIKRTGSGRDGLNALNPGTSAPCKISFLFYPYRCLESGALELASDDVVSFSVNSAPRVLLYTCLPGCQGSVCLKCTSKCRLLLPRLRRNATRIQIIPAHYCRSTLLCKYTEWQFVDVAEFQGYC